ncbi:MAG: hypothetical protein HRU70_13330 [Phycisphaeraceae bacterium]|nr:MAG: hypothetical protein HRU70_13330 [Phycisphaeraceae bacterium]
MFLRCAAAIVALGLVGCWVLSLRQSRLLAAHELASSQLRFREIDERLWAARSRIASLVTPEHVGTAVASLGPLKPLIMPVSPDGGVAPASMMEWALSSREGVGPAPDGSVVRVERGAARDPARRPRTP